MKDRTFAARQLMGSGHHRVFMCTPDNSVSNQNGNCQLGIPFFFLFLFLRLLQERTNLIGYQAQEKGGLLPILSDVMDKKSGERKRVKSEQIMNGVKSSY
jgi:hypothetical protein